MVRIVPFVTAALIAAYLAVSPSAVSAQCAFEHPRKASKFQTSLVQAFTGCADQYCYGNCPPNTETEGGIPACRPPETYDQQAGSPSNGWRWDETRGMGQVVLKASTTFPPHMLNPPANTADIAIQVKLKGIVDGFGPASGTGYLASVMRITFDDRASGDMTAVDFPLNSPFPMVGGKAKLQTSVDTILNSINQPGLPRCANVEVLSIVVLDPNSNTFGNEGLFLR